MTADLEQTVFVVDDDDAVRGALAMLMRSAGLAVEVFASAIEFLDRYERGTEGCLLLDVRMPDMSGLELQERLVEEKIDLPVIIITGHGDVPMAVRAIKAGAFDFVEKPFINDVLLERVQKALDVNRQQASRGAWQGNVSKRLAMLTPREGQVLEMVVSGLSNKAIASELGITDRTVEIHRAKVMRKMEAGSLAELVRMRLALDTTSHA